MPLERKALSYLSSASAMFIQTGIKSIDAMIPVGEDNELVIGPSNR
jgi:F0F1-type ATP synthase alpha subunit